MPSTGSAHGGEGYVERWDTGVTTIGVRGGSSAEVKFAPSDIVNVRDALIGLGVTDAAGLAAALIRELPQADAEAVRDALIAEYPGA